MEEQVPCKTASSTDATQSDGESSATPPLKSVEYISKLSVVNKYFKVKEKCGEGAFSAVFQVTARHPNYILAKRNYALKLLVPTSDPCRVRNEILALRIAGGSNNVITLHTALRQKDHVMLLMPFMPHTPFSQFYDQLSFEELQNYMFNLLLALRHVHRLGLIHRDIKPSNFLYNRELGLFALVDFGLAHAKDFTTERQLYEELNVPCPDLTNTPPPLSSAKRRRIDTLDDGATSKSESISLRRCLSSSSRLNEMPLAVHEDTATLAVESACRCALHSSSITICRGCVHLPRPNARRGGTNSYRPPEVLLRCTKQGTAVDIWAAGMIMAALVSSRAPFLRCEDDFDCLVGLAQLCGRQRLCQVAHNLGKRLQLFNDSVEQENAMKNDDNYGQRLRCACNAADKWPDSVYELLKLLLEPDPLFRVSATDALKHSFFDNRVKKMKKVSSKAAP